MATPDPDSFSLLEKIVAALVAIVTPLFGGYKWLEAKLDKKADKEDFDRLEARYESNRTEVRETQIKIFDRLDRIGQSLSRIEGKLEK